MGILHIGNAILKPHEEIRLASVVDLARHKLNKGKSSHLLSISSQMAR